MGTMERKKPRRRRSFTPEFKAETVERCRAGDRSDRPTVRPRQRLDRPQSLGPAARCSTSLILCTLTSRKAVAAFPDPPTLWLQERAAAQPLPGHPGGPITGERVVSCSWRNSPQGGLMLLTSDTQR